MTTTLLILVYFYLEWYTYQLRQPILIEVPDIPESLIKL
jgi:hypothetical protein